MQSELFQIDHDCRHGGPSPRGADGAAVQAVMRIAPHIVAVGVGGERGAGAELSALVAAARGSRGGGALAMPAASRMLRSCAVDALADSNMHTARGMARMSAFCEGQAGGDSFLDALEREGGGGEKGARALALYLAGVGETVSRAGLLGVLRRGMTCKCLVAAKGGGKWAL